MTTRGSAAYGLKPQYVSVKDFGAKGDGTTDDASAINAAITALNAAGGGTIIFTAGTYLHNTAITLKSNVYLSLYGATLQWGGGAASQVTCATTGVLSKAGIFGGTLNGVTSATTILELLSPYHCTFQDITFTGTHSTNIALFIGVNTSGGTNNDGNRNAAFNTFNNLLQDGQCGTALQLRGNSSGPTVVTLNTFTNFNDRNSTVRGIDFHSWCDNNHFAGMTRVSLGANNGVGVEWNTGTPGSNVGVYQNNFDTLAVDTFSGPTGRIAFKLNYCKQIKVAQAYNYPVAEGGVFSISGNAFSYDFGYADSGDVYLSRKTDSVSARYSASARYTPYILAKSSSAVTAPLDTNANTLATIVVPANSMGANGLLRVKAVFNAASGTTNRTLTITFGGTSLVSKILTNEVNMLLEGEISNANATNSQYCIPTFTSTNGIQLLTPTTSAIDTTAAANITLTCTKATGADPLILKTYSVELLSDGA